MSPVVAQFYRTGSVLYASHYPRALTFPCHPVFILFDYSFLYMWLEGDEYWWAPINYIILSSLRVIGLKKGMWPNSYQWDVREVWKGRGFKGRLTCYSKEPERAGPFLLHGDVSVTPQTAALRTKGVWDSRLRVAIQSEETQALEEPTLRFPITGHCILWRVFLIKTVLPWFFPLKPRGSWYHSFFLSISKVIANSGLQRGEGEEGHTELTCRDKEDLSYHVGWNPGMTSPPKCFVHLRTTHQNP